MTIQEAIESYDAITSDLTILLILLGAILLGFGIINATSIENIKKPSKSEIGSLFITVIGFIMVTSCYYQEFAGNQKQLVEWEGTVRVEYVNKLPIEKIEVLDYKGIGQKINDNQLKIQFTYVNQNIETIDTAVATIKPVKDLKKPYLEYQYIEKNLPQNEEEIIFKKGYHNAILYIPE